MKKRIMPLMLGLLLIVMAGCGQASDSSDTREETPSATPSDSLSSGSSSTSLTPNFAPDHTDDPDSQPNAEPAQSGTDTAQATVIRISDETHAVTFRLNDSTAARTLYDPLPLALAVQDYSNNEIFTRRTHWMSAIRQA